MEHPTPLLNWLCFRFADEPGAVPDYERAALDLHERTGHRVSGESLRHVARGYKRPGGLLAAAIQTWTDGIVSAGAMLTWPHYGRQPERAP